MGKKKFTSLFSLLGMGGVSKPEKPVPLNNGYGYEKLEKLGMGRELKKWV